MRQYVVQVTTLHIEGIVSVNILETSCSYLRVESLFLVKSYIGIFEACWTLKYLAWKNIYPTYFPGSWHNFFEKSYRLSFQILSS